MKILIINVVCGIRSTGRICIDLAQELEKQGHEVKIAYGRGEAPERYRKYAVKIGGKRDVYIHALKARIFDTAGFEGKRATKLFLQWADEYDPDLIWLHNLHGYYINIEMLFQWIKMYPEKEIRWTLHDCWAFTGHCTHFLVPKCDRWKKQCYQCPEKGSYPQSLFRDNSKENYRRKKELFCNIANLSLVTPSEWLKDQVKQSFLAEYPVTVNKNKIDGEIFKFTESDLRAKLGLEDKFVILGVAGIWTRRKGLHDFFKLAGRLDERFKIVLVGLTKKQRKKLPEGMIGIERTESSRELAMYYSMADVFVNLTYEENYPTVNLEAEACETRVLTYDTGGCRETIRRKDSQAVRTGDVGTMVKMIMRMEDIKEVRI